MRSLDLASRPATLLLLAIVLTLAAAEPALGRPDGVAARDVCVDADRSLVEQRLAARDAVIEVEGRVDDARLAALLADPSAWVRDGVVAALARRRDPAQLDALARLLPPAARRGPELLAVSAAELLGACGHAAGRTALEEALLEARDERAALAAVWALEALGAPASGPALERACARRPEPRVRGDALVALASLDPARARPHVTRALLARHDEAAAIAGLEAAARLDPHEGTAAAVTLVGEREGGPRVLYAALDLLADHPPADGKLGAAAVEALLARLGREPDAARAGRPRLELARALAALTGQLDLGDDLVAWRRWWSLARVTFEPRGVVRLPDGVRAAPARGAEPTARDAGATRSRPAFHGVPVESTRLVLLQDVSGGMLGTLDPRERGGVSRLRFALDELARLVGTLEPEVRLDVGLFASRPLRAAGRLVPVGRAREALVAWAERSGRPPTGEGLARSNLHDALADALDDPEVDTVFLLSEGGPTEGRFVDLERFVTHLARKNRYARVRVHCLQATWSRPGAEFLRRLSAALGGTFHDLDALLGARPGPRSR